MKKFIALTLVFFFLFGCGSSTVINSNPPGAKLYLDGQPIGGFIYKPEKPNQKGIIYCHGGFVNIQIDMEFPDVLNYRNNGFTVLVLKFEDENGNPPDPNRDRIEVKDAATVLKKIVPNLTDVCLVGVSRGGYVALEAFAYFPNEFKKCVAMIAPTDMENYDWTVWEQMHGNKEAFIKATQKYFAQTPSPMRLAEAGKYDGSRMLLLYGGKDPICPPKQHCIPLAQKTGCRYIIYPDASHNVHRLTEAQFAAMRFMQEWSPTGKPVVPQNHTHLRQGFGGSSADERNPPKHDRLIAEMVYRTLTHSSTAKAVVSCVGG